MDIGVVTLFPELVRSVTAYGIAGRAAERGLYRLALWNPRDFATDRHRSVDDSPYGGGPGMVMSCPPLAAALSAARAALGTPCRTVLLSPQGRPASQALLARWCQEARVVLVAGRYEGIDERFAATVVDEEVAVGDFVMSGGEVAAMALIDAMARLLPGALGDERSAQQDSFVDELLDYPHYTRPAAVAGATVPEVLTGGDHAAIGRWRRKQALARTLLRRPELLLARGLDAEERALLQEFVDELRRDRASSR